MSKKSSFASLAFSICYFIANFALSALNLLNFANISSAERFIRFLVVSITLSIVLIK